jgi:hypothetical protein
MTFLRVGDDVVAAGMVANRHRGTLGGYYHAAIVDEPDGESIRPSPCLAGLVWVKGIPISGRG